MKHEKIFAVTMDTMYKRSIRSVCVCVLQHLHIVFRDEAPLPLQDSLQPAGLPGQSYIVEDCASLEGELRVMLRLTGVDSLGLPLADTIFCWLAIRNCSWGFAGGRLGRS